MQLYYAPDSIALGAHIVLAESGLAYSLVKVDNHAHVIVEDGSSYFPVSPNGYVPALRLDNREILTEALAILQYIADTGPNRSLCPPVGTAARYRALSWTSYVATELHQKWMRFTQPDLTDAQQAAVVDLLKQRSAHVEAQLARSRYLEGDTPTIADFFLYVAMRWFKYREVDTAQWPHLHRNLMEIAERPAVQKALAEEGIS